MRRSPRWTMSMSQARRAWGLALLLGVGLGASGCASMRVQQVATWEAEGNESGLKGALSDSSEEVQEAAIAAWVRYGEYDTGRPSVLASLGSSQAAAARQAEKRLFGQPPRPVPDPHTDGAGSGPAVIYFYRAAGDDGEARWIVLDDSEKVRLGVGRYFRYSAGTGSHRACVQLPDADAPVTDDSADEGVRTRKVAPQCSTLMAHTAGIYFVRYRAQGIKGRPELKVMPVPPGLAAVKELTAVDPGDHAK